MKKRIFLILIGLVLLIAVLSGIKALQIDKMIEASSQFVQPPEPVTTAKVISVSWENVLPSIGSLTAVQGVTIATELPGKVVEIVFTPGSRVKKGVWPRRQNPSGEEPRLRGAEASLPFGSRNLSRAKSLIAEE